MIKEWPIALGPLGKATNAELVHLDGERGPNTRTHEVCYQGLELISSENQEDCVQLELLALICERQGLLAQPFSASLTFVSLYPRWLRW